MPRRVSPPRSTRRMQDHAGGEAQGALGRTGRAPPADRGPERRGDRRGGLRHQPGGDRRPPWPCSTPASTPPPPARWWPSSRPRAWPSRSTARRSWSTPPRATASACSSPPRTCRRAGRPATRSSTGSRASAPRARCSTPPTGAPRRASSPAPSPARPTCARRGCTSPTRWRSPSRARRRARPRSPSPWRAATLDARPGRGDPLPRLLRRRRHRARRGGGHRRRRRAWSSPARRTR